MKPTNTFNEHAGTSVRAYDPETALALARLMEIAKHANDIEKINPRFIAAAESLDGVTRMDTPLAVDRVDNVPVGYETTHPQFHLK